MRTAVVDVGGGLRGVYATGVLDRCLEEGVRFDAGVGVSAGSANIASYLAGQKGRNYQFYAEYSSRRELPVLRGIFQPQGVHERGTALWESGACGFDAVSTLVPPLSPKAAASSARRRESPPAPPGTGFAATAG